MMVIAPVSTWLVFGNGNLTSTRAVVAAFVGIGSGIIFWGLLIATAVTYIRERRKTTLATIRSHHKAYRYIWAVFFLLAIWGFVDVLRHHGVTDLPYIPGIPHARAMMFLLSMFLQVAVLGFWKLMTGLSWHESLFGFGGLDGKDEREKLIIQRASSFAFFGTVIALTLANSVLVLLPSLQTLDYANLISAIVLMSIGLRGFFAWKLGLR